MSTFFHTATMNADAKILYFCKYDHKRAKYGIFTDKNI